MSESSLAADEGQDTGISVDVDSDDPKKAVSRERPKTKPQTRGAEWNKERADTSKEVKRRFAAMQRQFDQRLAEQQAEFQRQLAERDQRLNSLGRTSDAPSADDAAHQASMDALQEKLVDAQERGDSREVAKITAEMTTLNGKFWAAKAAKAGVVDKLNDKTGGTTEQPRTTTQGSTRAGMAWGKANAEWWNDTSDPIAVAARNFANGLHKQMLENGDTDPETPEHYEHIRKEIAKRFPEIETVSTLPKRRQVDYDEADGEDDDYGQHRNPRRDAPSMLPNRGEPRQGAPRNGRQLTRDDLRVMRETGMDPNNNDHVMQYVRAGLEIEQENA